MGIKHLLDRPCVVCEFHTENGCSKWNCVFEQEPKTEWIPASERLPAENITVIGITNFGDIYKSELYDDCGKKKWYADGDYDVPIVAWIPFPEPYKESEDKE